MRPCDIVAGPGSKWFCNRKQDMVIGDLAHRMLNITDVPSRRSGTGLPTIHRPLSVLNSADREPCLWVQSFDRRKSNIPWPAHTQWHSFAPFVLAVTRSSLLCLLLR